jgi:2-methylcitrate dehydratase PrpD
VAAALADGEVTVDTFTAPALARLAAVRDKVRVHATTDLPQNGARIAITTTDGRTLEREQLVLHGSLADPMSFDELEGKFRANVAGRIRPEAIDEVVAAIGCLEKQRGLAAVTEPLLG